MIELAAILVLGIFSQWIAWKIKQPAILPLILIGLAIGPLSTFFTEGGTKLVDGDAIFSGDLLFAFVSIAVGVILFEGGLTLNISEIRSQAGVVRNLLIVGSLVTFLGGGLAAHYLMGVSWKMAFLFGALIIVSGPTVVTPIIRNVRPNSNVNAILKWEGILIDPFGALIAVLMYEFIVSSEHGAEYPFEIFKEFFTTISAGIVIGALSALFLYYLLKNNLLPGYLRNVFTLGLVIFTFAFAEIIHTEAGLLAATMMGIILANTKIDELKKISAFKEDVSLILISVLFILLSSRINLDQIEKLGVNSLLLFAVAIFVIRPIGVFLSTLKSKLSFKEKLFISWIGPKGIVAAAVASLFSINLQRASTGVDNSDAELLLPLVFLIIVGTVVIQGSSAKWIAGLLGVKQNEPRGVVIVGANELARKMARKLKEYDIYYIMVDTSPTNVKEAKKSGLRALEANILSDGIFEQLDMSEISTLAAITSNSGLNELACRWFEEEIKEENTLRLASKEEIENENLPLPKNVLFNSREDYVTIAQLLRKKGAFGEIEFENNAEFDDFMEKHRAQIIPIIVKNGNQPARLISGYTSKEKAPDKLLFIKKDSFDYSAKSQKKEKTTKTQEQ